MNVPYLISRRLKELGLEQKDLAAATQVTESYISQLLTRKKAPPDPGRTDLYEKMGEFLSLPKGELSKMAEVQRKEELKKRVAEPAAPLFKACREMILFKCEPDRQREVLAIFEKQPFGELERLVTQKLLDVSKRIAREEWKSEEWLGMMAQLSRRSYEQMRAALIEFVDTDVIGASVEDWVSFLDPLIESWDIDLKTFGVEIVLNSSLTLGRLRRFEFVEREAEQPSGVEPGFQEFLEDTNLSGDASDEEIGFLRTLKFKERRPTPIYFYRELQNLRDPLHFRASGQATEAE